MKSVSGVKVTPREKYQDDNRKAEEFLVQGETMSVCEQAFRWLLLLSGQVYLIMGAQEMSDLELLFTEMSCVERGRKLTLPRSCTSNCLSRRNSWRFSSERSFRSKWRSK